MLDLKLHGTALFVDVARLYALAHGLPLRHARAARGGGPAHARGAAGKRSLGHRLRVPADAAAAGADGRRRHADGNPNLLDTATLNDIDLRMLKETIRIARRLQQRMGLDYQR
jgi:CBS domain-containing protein